MKSLAAHIMSLCLQSLKERVWTRSHVPSLRGFDKSHCSRSRDSIIKYYWGWNVGSKLRATSISIQLDNKFKQHVLLYQFMCHQKKQSDFQVSFYQFSFITENMKNVLTQYGDLGKVVPFISTFLANVLVSWTTLQKYVAV